MTFDHKLIANQTDSSTLKLTNKYVAKNTEFAEEEEKESGETFSFTFHMRIVT